MDTALKVKLSYHRRLFLILLGFSWVLVGCFTAFQYGREKHFKVERLDSQLQLFNLRLLGAIDEGITPEKFIAQHHSPYADLRLTVIDTTGRVLFDSSGDSLTTNHLDRPEVAHALTSQTSYTIRRLSATTHRDYFYSAMRGEGIVVRSAVPYNASLTEILTADREFIWFMVGATLLMSIAAYFATRRLGHNITRLKLFAERAERGEQTLDNQSFPHDELGEISSHIVSLYARLERTTADRDREHWLAMQQEQEKIHIKKELTNNINHELKTPVAAILGYLETLIANPNLDAERRQAFLENGYAQAERLASLLTDVATISRMDEAERPLNREAVNLSELVATITSEMQLQPAERRLRVNSEIGDNIIIEGDRTLLTSIFRNLADNAAAYSSGRDLFIRLINQTDSHYTILFADNGIGIEEEHLPRIFERFYRIDKGRSRKLGGTGLGLAIVRNAVALHGGNIEVRNREQGGLEFIFSLSKR